MPRQRVGPEWPRKLPFLASDVTTNATDEEAFVRADNETDVGFPESKRMRMAAFVGVVAGEDFGCLCFHTAARSDSYHKNLNNMDALVRRHKKLDFLRKVTGTGIRTASLQLDHSRHNVATEVFLGVLTKSVSRGQSGLARAIEHLLCMKMTPTTGFGSGRTTNTNKCSPNNGGSLSVVASTTYEKRTTVWVARLEFVLPNGQKKSD